MGLLGSLKGKFEPGDRLGGQVVDDPEAILFSLVTVLGVFKHLEGILVSLLVVSTGLRLLLPS